MSQPDEPPRFHRAGIRLEIRNREQVRRVATRVGPWAFLLSTLCTIGVIGLQQFALLIPVFLGLATGFASMVLASRESELAGPNGTGSIEVQGRVLTVEQGAKKITCPLSDIEAAWIDDEGTCWLRLRSGREIATELSPEDSRELLRLTGALPGERAVPVAYASASTSFARKLAGAAGSMVEVQAKIMRVILPLFITLMAMGTGEAYVKFQRDGHPKHIIGGIVVDLLLITAMALLQRWRSRRQIVVGSDGIAIRGAFKKRFVPWDAIRSVGEMIEGGAVLELEDGNRIELPATPGGERIHQQIVDARRARSAHPSGAGVETIDRSGKTIERWREDLRALTRPTADYRRAGIASEQLAALIADPASPPDRRLGAAYLLSRMDEPARERVRIAIDSCADAPMKAALERAAEGELAEDEVTAAEERDAAARATID